MLIILTILVNVIYVNLLSTFLWFVQLGHQYILTSDYASVKTHTMDYLRKLSLP